MRQWDSFNPRGVDLKCLRRRREEEGVEESRTDALFGPSRRGWGEKGGRDGRKKNLLFFSVGIELKMATK